MGYRHFAATAAAFCMLFVFCATAGASVACPDDLTPPTRETAAAASMALVCDMNVLRAQNGLRPLRWDWRLWAAAERMAVDMTERHFFSHVTPDGRNLVDRVLPTGYLPDEPSWTLTENLAWGRGALSTPLSVAFGWMGSPAHRENVLDPVVDDVGIGVIDGPPDLGGIVYVADFGTRGIVAPPAPPVTPTKPSRSRRVARLRLPRVGMAQARGSVRASGRAGTDRG